MSLWEKVNNWFQKFLPKDTAFAENKMVFSTTEIYLAEIIKLKLEEEGIPVILINKRDSSYNNFGAIELYVHRDNVMKAKYLINQSNE